MGQGGDSNFDDAELEQLIASLPDATRTALRSENSNGLHAALPEVYGELRELARGYLRRERSSHTLQPTALVHEAYLRLLGQRNIDWENRAHMLAIAARMMRRILSSYARDRAAAKRGGGQPHVTLDAALDVFEQVNVPAETLHTTLTELEQLDPRQAQIVEMRFYGGLTIEETAEVLGISSTTVKREWTTAKMWLQRALAGAA